MEYASRTCAAPAGHAARQRLVRDLSGFSGRKASHAGRALHGLRRSFLPNRMSRQQSDSRLERSGVSRTLEGCRSPVARDQQFPRIHRADLSRAVRSLLRAGHQSTRRSRSSRSKKISSSADLPKAGFIPSLRRSAPGKKWRSSVQGRRDWLRRSSCAARGIPLWSTKRQTASADCCVYGIPEFKMEKHIIDRRLEQMSAEGVKFVTECGGGQECCGRGFAARLRCHRARRRRGASARSESSRARTEGHPLRNGISAAAKSPLSRRHDRTAQQKF